MTSQSPGLVLACKKRGSGQRLPPWHESAAPAANRAHLLDRFPYGDTGAQNGRGDLKREAFRDRSHVLGIRDRVALERAVDGVPVALCERTSRLGAQAAVLAVQARVGEPLYSKRRGRESAKWDARMDPTSHQAGIRQRTGQEAHLNSDSIANLDRGVRAVPDRNNISSSVLSCKGVSAGTVDDGSPKRGRPVEKEGKRRSTAHPSCPPTSGFLQGAGQSPFL